MKKPDSEVFLSTKQLGVTTDLPGSLRMIKQIQSANECSTVCGFADHVFVALASGHLMGIQPEFQISLFEAISKSKAQIVGMGIRDNYLLLMEKGNPHHTVHVSDLKSSNEVASWNHEEGNLPIGSLLAVVGQQVVMVDRAKKRLSVYSLSGEVKMNLACPLKGRHWASICNAVDNSVILSDYSSHKVHRININSGGAIWTAEVKKPMGVTCYRDKFVLVATLSKDVNIYILDITTGKSHDMKYLTSTKNLKIKFKEGCRFYGRHTHVQIATFIVNVSIKLSMEIL